MLHCAVFSGVDRQPSEVDAEENASSVSRSVTLQDSSGGALSVERSEWEPDAADLAQTALSESSGAEELPLDHNVAAHDQVVDDHDYSSGTPSFYSQINSTGDHDGVNDVPSLHSQQSFTADLDADNVVPSIHSQQSCSADLDADNLPPTIAQDGNSLVPHFAPVFIRNIGELNAMGVVEVIQGGLHCI